MKDRDVPVTTMDEILHPGIGSNNVDAGFPDAPTDWNVNFAKEEAARQGLKLSKAHVEVIKALQHYFARHQESVNLRELHDALDEHFHANGGLKYLYELLPGGPVAQGCILAGLAVPPGSIDLSYGSVV